MRPNPSFVLFIFLLFVGLSSSTYISNDALNVSVPRGRNLLNSKTTTRACPINVRDQNHRIITSQCKGPNYSPKSCCNGFKQFICPIADHINDKTNNCATAVFRFIYQFYPPGLFNSLCVQSAKGLECPSGK